MSRSTSVVPFVQPAPKDRGHTLACAGCGVAVPADAPKVFPLHDVLKARRQPPSLPLCTEDDPPLPEYVGEPGQPAAQRSSCARIWDAVGGDPGDFTDALAGVASYLVRGPGSTVGLIDMAKRLQFSVYASTSDRFGPGTGRRFQHTEGDFGPYTMLMRARQDDAYSPSIARFAFYLIAEQLHAWRTYGVVPRDPRVPASVHAVIADMVARGVRHSDGTGAPSYLGRQTGTPAGRTYRDLIQVNRRPIVAARGADGRALPTTLTGAVEQYRTERGFDR